MLKILIAVDGSSPSLDAARHAILLAQQGLKAHFVLAHVQQEASLLELATQGADLIAAASLEAGKHLVAEAENLIRAAGLSYEVEIELGEAAGKLVEIAERMQCQQIIIGALGRSGLRSVLIGSVSREVARKSRLPVTIVKHADASDEASAQNQEPAEEDFN
ncbi:universal stress protein [Comamonas composti]|uniref:universal stress protein n=1 Tax=Comamonas composti TaxID=408558 RepID=UPI00042609AE|nr:universal stress protein [Comamonas composti]